MSEIREQARAMKRVAPVFGGTSDELRVGILENIYEALGSHRDEIFAANALDMEDADSSGVPDAVKKRLKFDEGKLNDVREGIRMLIDLPDPVGRVTLKRELDEGLTLVRQTVPIGVIGVIFEARPDALVQIASLCIRSGNCAILKGGKETRHSNKVLFDVIHDALVASGVSGDVLAQAESHAEIDELLECEGLVDLLIPRGSNSFVKYIMDHTAIPVMGHADGICHIFVDDKCDEDVAIRVIVDAKTQYTAACNAVETILVSRDAAKDFLPKLAAALAKENVKIRGTDEVVKIINDTTDQHDLSTTSADEAISEKHDKLLTDIEVIADDDFANEYLSLVVGVKLVSGVDEAIEHINRYGSHHTDAIITTDDTVAEKFMQLVDSAGVYHNCSTRFADGFRYGFGAEVGISTAKLHARGPVGLEGLVTYKYKLYGSGQIVADYASGKSQFTHKDLL